jgi:hypothetical protein
VLSNYKKCSSITNCNCAIYLRLNTLSNTSSILANYAYVDFCKTELITNKKNEIDINYWSNANPKISALNCSFVISNTTSDLEWDMVEASFENFRCAKLAQITPDKTLLSYAVKF